MPTDPQHFKRKEDNDLKTNTFIKLTSFSFLSLSYFFECLFLVDLLIIDNSEFSFSTKKKYMKNNKIVRPTDPIPSSAC